MSNNQNLVIVQPEHSLPQKSLP